MILRIASRKLFLAVNFIYVPTVEPSMVMPPHASPKKKPCTNLELTIVGGTEIPLSGAFPSGRINDTTCRYLPLQVISAIITHLAEQGL